MDIRTNKMIRKCNLIADRHLVLATEFKALARSLERTTLTKEERKNIEKTLKDKLDKLEVVFA